jgi:hypothetical protein
MVPVEAMVEVEVAVVGLVNCDSDCGRRSVPRRLSKW